MQGDRTIPVPLKCTRLLNWTGQLAHLDVISVDNTRMIVNSSSC